MSGLNSLRRIHTVTFNGLEILDVDLQVQIASGMPVFIIVGLPDKAVGESRERIRSAFHTLGLDIPAKRIIINLAPADLLKEGSHFDLAIAAGLLSAMDIIPPESIQNHIILGELGLDGSIIPVNGVLPVAIHAKRHDLGLICPAAQGSEAVWSEATSILAPRTLLELINHCNNTEPLKHPTAEQRKSATSFLDMKDVKGQETAKRALEIAAAGGHNVLMSGPPGAGKSMLASRLPGILPPLTTEEALETSMIHSIAGELKDGKICFDRPYRDPHHNASTPSLIGGGRKAQPGEISLAHNGVLFLDELPEFNRATLEALRQPLENGRVTISRVQAHTEYPAKFQLVAAMNPCRCGYLGNHELECKRAPLCAEEYQSKISGPLMDRIDIHIDVPAVKPFDLANIPNGESSAQIRARIIKARTLQKNRFIELGYPQLNTNSELKGDLLEELAALDQDSQNLLVSFAEKNHLSARAYHRILRLARTIADLQSANNICKLHIAEALSYRRILPKSRR